jgi:hypothetical protein
MPLLDGVYTGHADGHLRFHRVAAPTGEELSRLVHTLAQRIGRYLERQGLLQRDGETCPQCGGAMKITPAALAALAGQALACIGEDAVMPIKRGRPW